VQRSQIELLQIEIDRFLKESRPFFTLQGYHFHNLIKEEDTPNIVFHLKQQGDIELVNLKIFPMPGYDFELISEYSDKVRFNDTITIMFFVKKDLQKVDFHSFLIFEDRYKNKYRQVLNVYSGLEGDIKADVSALSINDSITETFNELI
jgi:hypothetical protein